jgi:intracellular multiplication protein IcmB
MSVFSTAITESGEKLSDAASRLVMAAIREFPIFQRPTAFDIGDSKIVALDLMDVSPGGGETAEKQTALMYMLARFVLAKDFYVGRDNLKYIPPEYHSWHEPRIRRLREMPKRIIYDEFHRTSKAIPVREQVEVDQREGRKFGVHICLASQRLEDFSEAMIDLATGIWIMGVSERGAVDAQKLFNLSPTALYILRNNLGSPGKAGAPFLAVLSLKEGRHEHFLYNTLGPIALWAFSTTAEDVALRTRLYEILGPKETRLELSKRFPGGSAKEEIERRVRVALDKGTYRENDKAEQGVIEQMVSEIAGVRYRKT